MRNIITKAERALDELEKKLDALGDRMDEWIERHLPKKKNR